MKELPQPIQFEWDKGNSEKSLKKHGITIKEAEEMFLNEPLFVVEDAKHSLREAQYMAWGQTNSFRCLTAIYTVRNERIRIISVRSMSRKERKTYEKNI